MTECTSCILAPVHHTTPHYTALHCTTTGEYNKSTSKWKTCACAWTSCPNPQSPIRATNCRVWLFVHKSRPTLALKLLVQTETLMKMFRRSQAKPWRKKTIVFCAKCVTILRDRPPKPEACRPYVKNSICSDRTVQPETNRYYRSWVNFRARCSTNTVQEKFSSGFYIPSSQLPGWRR